MLNHKRLLFNLYKYKRKLIGQILNQSRTFSASPSSTVSKILFFGTDNFSLPSLKILHSNNIELGTVTSFKNPANCVRHYAEKHNLPLLKWPVDAQICQSYELGVVVSFGHLIPTNIIQALPFGMINVHASLLPRWRGAAPIIYALLNGDVETGVSIMKIEPKRFDIGDILDSERVPIKDNCFMPELHSALANKGAELLLQVVKNYKQKQEHAKKQNEQLVTYAPKVTTALTEVVWSELNASEIYRRFRALYGFKNLITKFQSKQVQLIAIKIPDKKLEEAVKLASPSPGSFMYSRERKSLLVRCLGDSYLEILQLRVEGRKIMSAQDFNNGFLKKLRNADAYFVGNKNLAVFN